MINWIPTRYNNIHPYKKYEQAKRVSALIDAVIYGGQSVDKLSLEKEVCPKM